MFSNGNVHIARTEVRDLQCGQYVGIRVFRTKRPSNVYSQSVYEVSRDNDAGRRGAHDLYFNAFGVTGSTSSG